MTAAIEVRGVSKKYFRGVRHGHTRVSEALTQWGHSLLGRQRSDNPVHNDRKSGLSSAAVRSRRRSL